MDKGAAISGIDHAIMRVKCRRCAGINMRAASMCISVLRCGSFVMCMSFLMSISFVTRSSLDVHACVHVDMLKPMRKKPAVAQEALALAKSSIPPFDLSRV